jgi:hypothetical protein
MTALGYLDLQGNTTWRVLKAKDKKRLPDQNLSQVPRELPINVLLCVSKLQAVERGSN